jgi:hypothetical protein
MARIPVGPLVGDTNRLIRKKPISTSLAYLENHGRSAMLKNLSTRGIDIGSPMYERQRFRRKRALHPDDKESVERNSGIHRRGGPDR